MRKRLTDQINRAKMAAANGMRREISDDFVYNKKKLKYLGRVLHNVNIAIRTLVSALNDFSRMKGPSISPDGMLGGLGYIMTIKEIKEGLNNTIKILSDIQDSLADEMTNPKWNAEKDKEVKKILKEKEQVEEKVEEQAEEEELLPEDVVTSEDVKINEKLAFAIRKRLIETRSRKEK